ncbi:MAG: hypothetical protein ABI882_01585 [Acidobacteriota bacterium]
MVTAGNEETLQPNKTGQTNQSTEVLTNGFVDAAPFEFPELKEQINSIIHEGLNDMWLLLTGEEIKGRHRSGERRDGRPIGLLWGDQVHMLTSKPTAIETLRILGIEML